MNDISPAPAEGNPAAQWLDHGRNSQRSSFVLLGATGDLAVRHYEHAPEVEGRRRRLASFVDLGSMARHIDMEPSDDGWVFSAQKLGRHIALEALAATTDELLHDTKPDADPLTKGIQQAVASGLDFHPNQAGLLGSFDHHVVYEDPHVLALNKPPYVGTHWSQGHYIGAAEIAQTQRGPATHAIHRLDGLTSGVLLLGKTKQALRALSKQFANTSARHLEKGYVALIDGSIETDRYIECYLQEKKGRVSANDHGRFGKLAKTAVAKLTDVRTVDGRQQSLVAVQIFTGRTHQIRASLARIGRPVVDDPLYNRRPVRGRMRLHAAYLKISHPITKRPMGIFAPLPSDFFSAMDDRERAHVEHALSVFQPTAS